MKLKDFVDLIRVRQWYKNLVIFIPILFSLNLFEPSFLFRTILCFISLSLISSSYYIVNDIIDIKKDRYHPEKANRPLASNKIKVITAIFIVSIFALASILLALSLSYIFTWLVIFLFLFTLIYSLYLKKELLVDAIAVSINFVVKAISGVFLINVPLSPWIVVSAFFLALFLVFGKRKSDLITLGKKAADHKSSLKYYSVELLNTLLTSTISILLLSYALYAVLVNRLYLLLTLPIAFYLLFRYLDLINKGSEIARHPERIIRDKRMLIGILLWIILVVIILYTL